VERVTELEALEATRMSEVGADSNP